MQPAHGQKTGFYAGEPLQRREGLCCEALQLAWAVAQEDVGVAAVQVWGIGTFLRLEPPSRRPMHAPGSQVSCQRALRALCLSTWAGAVTNA